MTSDSAWPTVGRPRDVGLDEAVLAASDRAVREVAPEVHSLLVVRHGVLAWERYYPGQARDVIWGRLDESGQPVLTDFYPVAEDATTVHNVKSVTKSLMSAVAGASAAKGVLDLDATLRFYLPEYVDRASDPAKGDITIRNLLMMRSGLEWHENEQITVDWLESEDPLLFSMQEQQVVAPPGERWEYSTADTHLLGACMSRAAGRPLLRLCNEMLFEPLGFTVDRWGRDTTGHEVGGSEIYLRPREMAAVGQLFLQRGAWNGRQVIPPDWVELSTAPQPDVTADFLRENARFELPPDFRTYRDGYAYLWWRTDFGTHSGFSAVGFGGQTIAVVPDLDLVVVETTSTEIDMEQMPPLERMTTPFRMIDDFVIPAILET
jgi:CubicO group peptidase (beta-lactamase class C family)